MFDEGSIVLKRISLSKFGSNRKAAHKRRLLFDKLYLMAEFNPKNEGYGCVITTIANLAHKTPILTQNEARRGIDWLHENNFIHRERSSKYCNNGYLIKINHYEKLNKIKVLGNANQLPTNCQPTDEQLTSITIGYIKENITSEKPTANQLPTNCNGNDNTYNQRKERKERNIDIPSGNTPEVVLDSAPKKTREKKEKVPVITAAIYTAYREAIKKRHSIELSAQGGADVRKVLKELVVEYGEEKAIAMVRAYVELKDDFLEKNKHHIKFISSKTNVVIEEARSTRPEEEVPMKWCQYREKMVPMTKQRINGQTIWE